MFRNQNFTIKNTSVSQKNKRTILSIKELEFSPNIEMKVILQKY